MHFICWDGVKKSIVLNFLSQPQKRTCVLEINAEAGFTTLFFEIAAVEHQLKFFEGQAQKS